MIYIDQAKIWPGRPHHRFTHMPNMAMIGEGGAVQSSQNWVKSTAFHWFLPYKMKYSREQHTIGLSVHNSSFSHFRDMNWAAKNINGPRHVT